MNLPELITRNLIGLLIIAAPIVYIMGWSNGWGCGFDDASDPDNWTEFDFPDDRVIYSTWAGAYERESLS